MQVHNLYLLLSFIILHSQAIVLFEHFKELEGNIAHISLANLPTPIGRCHTLEKILDHNAIYIKRDDLTGHHNLYGGNKVRKLEFLLADALQKNAKKIITSGCIGSNHCVATACYAKQLGLGCLLMLTPQPNSSVVRQNLLLDHYFNACLMMFKDGVERNNVLNHILEYDNDVYFIPTGGSVPIGTLGFVNAALELKEQIDDGIMPEPDVIYLPIGSCGTTAGLLLGLQLANINAKIVAVSVAPIKDIEAFAARIKKLFFDANQLLHAASTTIPLLAFPEEQLIINNNDCFGSAYGAWLPCVDGAAQLMKEEGIQLECTYSAKAFAALIADIKNHDRHNDVILFWNTYCGLDFSELTNSVNYIILDPMLYHYFENIDD